MRRSRISIITVNCKRCGKSIATASRSIYGADAAKVAFGNICQSCTADEEKHEILHCIGETIIKKVVSQ